MHRDRPIPAIDEVVAALLALRFGEATGTVYKLTPAREQGAETTCAWWRSLRICAVVSLSAAIAPLPPQLRFAEAAASRDAFKRIPKADREAPLEFLDSAYVTGH